MFYWQLDDTFTHPVINLTGLVAITQFKARVVKSSYDQYWSICKCRCCTQIAFVTLHDTDGIYDGETLTFSFFKNNCLIWDRFLRSKCLSHWFVLPYGFGSWDSTSHPYLDNFLGVVSFKRCLLITTSFSFLIIILAAFRFSFWWLTLFVPSSFLRN